MSTQSNDVTLITAYFIRICFEQKNKTFVPMGVKNIVLIYTNKCIAGTKLLTFAQDIDLFPMLEKYIKGIQSFKLLYRGSENEFSAQIFQKKCIGLDKAGQIVIIKSNHDAIFGGYISKDWSKQTDESAFIFLVQSNEEDLNEKCPKYFPIKSRFKKVAISHRTGVGDWQCGPHFGLNDIYIGDNCNEKGYYWDMDTKKTVYYSKNYTYFQAYEDHGEGVILCGGPKNSAGDFDVVDYEVFKVLS